MFKDVNVGEFFLELLNAVCAVVQSYDYSLTF